MRRYQAIFRDSVKGAYRGHTILTQPAPASGPTVLEILNLLSGFDLPSLSHDDPAAYHLIAEALRIASVDRIRWLGDPNTNRVPCDGLANPGFAAVRRALLNPDSAPTTATPAGDPTPFGAGGCRPQLRISLPLPGTDDQPTPSAPTGTSAFVVVDRDGNVASFTQTLALHFGSGITVPGRGFLLNDTLSDFHALPTSASNNLPAPGKRPRSSIAPTIILDPNGQFHWALGAAGGAWITPAIVRVITDLVDWDYEPQDAINDGRIRASDSRGAVMVEPTLPDSLVAALEARGHVVTRIANPQAAAQVIARNPATGQLIGGADARRDGAVVSR